MEKKYYEVVSVQDEMPPVANENYLTISENGFETARFWNGTRFEIAHYEGVITHWLKPLPNSILLSVERYEALMAGNIIREFNSDKYYWCKCENCGWEDSSEFTEGCHPMGDTGDHSDPLCPICYSNKIEGDETIEVPEDYTGVHSIAIPVELHINAYKKVIDQLNAALDNYRYPAPATPLPQTEVGEELPAPIGDFIFEQTDIIPLISHNGNYYHYSDVCTLLNRVTKKQ